MNKTYPYTIDNGNGELITFTGRTQGPAGERVGVDGVAQPGAGPPMHVHYLQEEAVQVVRGRVGYQVPGGEPQFAGPGESVAWPAGTPHKWWNAGTDEVQMIGWCTPPGNIEFFLSTLVRVDERERRQTAGTLRRRISRHAVSNRIRAARTAGVRDRRRDADRLPAGSRPREIREIQGRSRADAVEPMMP